MPFWVLTTLPAGIVLDEVKSLFRNRTTPLAFASSTRLPVVGKVFVAVASTVTTSAGTTLASASGEVTLGIGPDRHPDRSHALVLRRHDDRRGRQHEVGAHAADQQRERDGPQRDQERRPGDRPDRAARDGPAPDRTVLDPRIAVRGSPAPSRIDVPGRRRGSTPAAGVGRGGRGGRADRGRGGGQLGRLHVVEGLLDGRVRGRGRGRRRDDRSPGRLTGQGRGGRGGGRGLRRLGRARRSRRARCARSPRRPSGRRPSAPGSSESSYSPTELKTGSPAEAARARVAASLAMIERRFSWVSASRASNRKLIRDVATRDPCGSTTAARRPSTVRMRAAAEVISSSMSR